MSAFDPVIVKPLENGTHTGIVKDISEREVEGKGYSYVDITIGEVNGNEAINLRHSVSANMAIDEYNNPRSQLARILSALGADISKTVQPSELVGAKVSFMTLNKENDEGVMFANVVPDSLKAI